ncbi:MAG: SusC/RagA family protein [Bacteroidetes bacterium GWF2_42_66]|nr:MAG: SusC/RagA family protein [Bacteroidetes bacterium GWA2_42_15]OFY03316.1 MAG: SusC/RagA family protein [Bacteroidetes bacterium GWE2_42_39]OFY45730.1 MAG: SusC/RagA family protein [Bacteroidetes bacterium GWF2_42_66]
MTRLCVLMVLLTLGSVSASVYSQNSKLTLKMKSSKLADVFNSIEEQTDFYFFYNRDQLNDQQIVSVDVENKKVEEVLDELFRGQDIAYKIDGRNILIEVKGTNLIRSAQQKTVSGKVTDSAGAPLPGVTVVVKGTTQGIITDFDGKYSLNNVPNDATLVFSFVGMKVQEIAVSGKSSINIKMEEETVGIEEVVAIGYGTMKKSDLTGSMVSVSSDKLNTFPIRSIEQALQGRAAGVQITSLNGEPGSEIKMRVRGSTSINAGNEPLFVVDGFAGANSPPAEDIQSVEILKDASATAIYGSRGANGVILITTKRGTAGELKIEASTSYSIQKISNLIDMLNAEQFAQFQNDYREATGSPTIPYPDPSALGVGTDWQDVIFRSGALQNYQVSVSGGTDKLKIYSSGKYYKQKGIIINSDFEAFNGRSNIDVNFSEKIKLGTQMQFSHFNKNGVLTQNLQSGGSGVISGALTFQPDLGIYDNEGNYTISTFGDVRNNPYAIASERTEQSVGNNFVGNAFIDYEIYKDLKFHSSFGVQLGSDRSGTYLSNAILLGSATNGKASMSGSRSLMLITENYLTYAKTIADIHKINIMAGYSYQSRSNEWFGATSQSFITDSFLFWNLGAGATPVSPQSALTEWLISSYYSRFNYNFKDRYLITLTGRYDGSSRFGANNKWGFFPSGAFAWNVKQEPFMQQIDKLSHLKIRTSYGVTGNTEIGAYSSMAKLGNAVFAIEGERVNAVVPSSVANASLSWESTEQSNIGLDIGFFKERVNFTADYYNKITSDLLYEVPLPKYSGYSTSLRNWGKVRNRGFEFSLNSIVTDKLLKWSTDFNISFNKNKILELPEGDVIWNALPGGIFATSTHIRTVGQPNGVFYGYVFDGVYQEGNDFSAEPDKSPGEIKYRDIKSRDADGNLTGVPDGTVNSDDRQIIGDPNPDFTFGFTNDFKFKNFELNIFLNGSVGNDMINFTRMELETMNGYNNTTTAYLDAWTPTNTDTDVPAVGYSYWEFSSRWVEDASFLRVKNISLGYSLPSSFLKKLNLSKWKIYISGQDLITLTKYSGYDPEVSWNDSNSNTGSDYGSYPHVKSYTIGMNIEF